MHQLLHVVFTFNHKPGLTIAFGLSKQSGDRTEAPTDNLNRADGCRCRGRLRSPGSRLNQYLTLGHDRWPERDVVWNSPVWKNGGAPGFGFLIQVVPLVARFEELLDLGREPLALVLCPEAIGQVTRKLVKAQRIPPVVSSTRLLISAGLSSTSLVPCRRAAVASISVLRSTRTSSGSLSATLTDHTQAARDVTSGLEPFSAPSRTSATSRELSPRHDWYR